MYLANNERYTQLPSRRVGRTGLQLPIITLGLWHHYSSTDPIADRKKVLLKAFDSGVFSFDVADHYGAPDFGSAEELLGSILQSDLKPYRHELVIATKVGYKMFAGPYGEMLSRKAILQGIDASLQRLGTDYVDIYYAHRVDPETDMQETAQALDQVVREGKALYIGISNYDPKQTATMVKLFKDMGTPFTVNQASYNLFNRTVETSGLLTELEKDGAGLVAYGPLSEGLLSQRYLNGIPNDFAIHPTNKATLAQGKDVVVKKLNALNNLAKNRDQTLSQMALAWLLRHKTVTSVIIGTTSEEHLAANLAAAKHLDFSADELAEIERILRA
ncbi:aldo/keto reductase [Loigolactobacillus backii]|uniref:Aldo/keto reductase n=1 Tax=Loigolactobacillus backii TaxID=375175 RepID=A0A192H078_9LACO|nr:aldo/keto reductase [Loigolactobacillus backii]ANK60671.1 aldo/keto reductase [Loigolactobacillus backii]ANK61760.1 aldo/keto reductase [Loigolactobacillus backii]ANK68099.1 aldo/keto reductase [Loigolactobacillus backii]ANK69046.1 aldo/keto reductase [Loigolactobacillus backii]MDA5387208.1 aldo/keto reductase [Loigolactobacillus backii]